MSLSDLASLGTFVSAIAVVVSLIYLAVQVQHGRKHTAAQISQSRVAMGLQQQSLFIADPTVADIMLRCARGDESVTETDAFRFHFLVSNMFMMSEDEFRQYKAGLISEARHKGFVTRMSVAMRLPGYRAMWAAQRDGFGPDFQTFMDEIVREARRQGLPLSLRAVFQTALATETAALSSSKVPPPDAALSQRKAE